MTATNDSNPWWSVFQEAITAAGGKLAKPEILPSTTDARFMRQLGIPTLGFSPMKNTPILLHDHNEFLKDTVYLEGIKCCGQYDRLDCESKVNLILHSKLSALGKKNASAGFSLMNASFNSLINALI
ncbi:unnamed protein product [Ilex paraguariensis]|uniref:Aminoacylase-1 n=1 Tax=Ilex paraguariensis TaxID=185542 RepID=A0ABC8UTY6_9AQUA